MLKIGKINELTVCETCTEGHYLKAEDSDIQILMPDSFGPKDLKIGQKVEAFIYYEDDQLLIATTTMPSALVDEYALMNVVEIKGFGAFFNWTKDKDLLVPETEQRLHIGLNESHIVRVCIDERTNKIYGTTMINQFIESSEFDITSEDKVTLIPAIDEERGYRCIIDKKYIGMIYHSETFQPITIGKPLQGVVKKIREDGLVDLALQVQGFKNLVNSQDKIMAYLKQAGGISPLHDKSSPQEIQEALNMSKKTFKNTIGILYKSKQIIIKKDGIELINK